MGKLNGHDIYQLAGADIIPYARSNTHLTNKQIEDNNTYERMVRLALDTPGMYFSYSYDLTHCLQRLHSVTPDFHRMSITNRADPRFLWNGFLLRDFSHHQYSRFTLPLIQGFVSINNVTVNGHQLTWSLVSRRCVDRAGTRFFMRGVDAQGNVANFVETEQIIERGGEKSSFVQTRGSIPLFWSQYPDIKYKPTMQLAHEDHLNAALRVLAVTSSDDEKHPYLDKLFNNVWADHADTISTQYSGTGALKTDYTRTGKRTHLGLIRDGINSLTRYYKNNFSDGFRQDSIDLFLGKYVIVDGEGNTLPCPLRRDRDWKYITFPSVLLVAMSMFCASATLPQRVISNGVLL
ncbi:hypothetical protein B5X24_HaOG206877 [Helicoverpa armigera]|uniref:Phosphatidylinositol-3-phosphatase SAC1 n=1 Tax=Helicoverpa armigera TaxID=29058 RepID=A0A2W1BMX3_HELAM|nr:hypothetical protein B5X24_HaOG206877 [Helicoverpa armigera]